MGSQIYKVVADKQTNSAVLYTSDLNTGIYLVYLQIDGVGVASEQLIVIH